MERIDQIIDSYPEIDFRPVRNAPDNWEGDYVYQDGHPFIIYWNVSLQESIQLQALQHEIAHFKRCANSYNEKDEYNADVDASLALVDENEIFHYFENNPGVDEVDVAEFFGVDVSQLRQWWYSVEIRGDYQRFLALGWNFSY